MTETITTVKVLLRAERHDGNDPIEAIARLPIIPRKGDTISVWRDGEGLSRGEVYLDVEAVVLCTWAPESIEVWVRMDGYDLSDVEEALRAVDRNDQP